MVSQKFTGIILNIKPYKDYDRLITFFSREGGIILIIAKGVRKITSRRNFSLDIINLVSIETECSLATAMPNPPLYLREITLQEPYRRLKSSLEHFAAAFVVSHFLMRIMPLYTPHQAIFELTKETLKILNSLRHPHETLRIYFLKCMRVMGHIPNRILKHKVRTILLDALKEADPQFILMARRTLGIFSRVPKIRSN